MKLDSLEKSDKSLINNTFSNVLNSHAPIKTKILQVISYQFMTVTLWRAIMTRSRLKNIYLKSRSEENWVKHKRQQNFCTNLLRETKQKHSCNVSIKDLNDSKRFCKK